MPTRPPTICPRRAAAATRRGMTLVELSIGMVVTTIVMGALFAVWFGVANAWNSSTSSQSVALTGNLAASRLESTFRTTKYLCQYAIGSVDGSRTPVGSVFFWKNDAWTADGAVQVAELALIEHDPVTKRLYLYEAKPSLAMTADQHTRASLTFTWADLIASGTPAAFKGYDFVQQKVFSEAVKGAAFNCPTPKPGSRPTVEFTLTISRPGGDSLVYGSAAVRAPTTRPQ
jgi:prepilin-type N-terminal cleavage/methylation domain-containing protein